MGHKIFFEESGHYGEHITMTDNRCGSKYLRYVLGDAPSPEHSARECVGWQVVCRGLHPKRARREFARNVAQIRRQNRRLWLLIQRKEAVHG